mgnify:CR=1 FL=1
MLVLKSAVSDFLSRFFDNQNIVRDSHFWRLWYQLVLYNHPISHDVQRLYALEKDAVIQEIRKLWKLAQTIEDGILEDEYPLYKKERDNFRKKGTNIRKALNAENKTIR